MLPDMNQYIPCICCLHYYQAISTVTKALIALEQWFHWGAVYTTLFMHFGHLHDNSVLVKVSAWNKCSLVRLAHLIYSCFICHKLHSYAFGQHFNPKWLAVVHLKYSILCQYISPSMLHQLGYRGETNKLNKVKRSHSQAFKSSPVW